MGNWQELKSRPYSSCDSCEMGFCSISHKTEGGKDYVKTDDCHETCGRFKNHVYQREENSIKDHIFGDNIREAIRVIRGN